MFVLLTGIILPLVVILSPLCKDLKGLGKLAVFAICVPVALFLAAIIQTSIRSPEENAEVNRRVIQKEMQEKREELEKEATDKAEKDFHEATKPYRN